MRFFGSTIKLLERNNAAVFYRASGNVGTAAEIASASFPAPTATPTAAVTDCNRTPSSGAFGQFFA